MRGSCGGDLELRAIALDGHLGLGWDVFTGQKLSLCLSKVVGLAPHLMKAIEQVATGAHADRGDLLLPNMTPELVKASRAYGAVCMYRSSSQTFALPTLVCTLAKARELWRVAKSTYSETDGPAVSKWPRKKAPADGNFAS